jgi:hypothetical protein
MGSRGLTYTDPESGKVIADAEHPIEGEADKMLANRRYGKTETERKDAVKAYLSDVDELTTAAGLEPYQAKQIADLRRDRRYGGEGNNKMPGAKKAIADLIAAELVSKDTVDPAVVSARYGRFVENAENKFARGILDSDQYADFISFKTGKRAKEAEKATAAAAKNAQRAAQAAAREAAARRKSDRNDNTNNGTLPTPSAQEEPDMLEWWNRYNERQDDIMNRVNPRGVEADNTHEASERVSRLRRLGGGMLNAIMSVARRGSRRGRGGEAPSMEEMTPAQRIALLEEQLAELRARLNSDTSAPNGTETRIPRPSTERRRGLRGLGRGRHSGRGRHAVAGGTNDESVTSAEEGAGSNTTEAAGEVPMPTGVAEAPVTENVSAAAPGSERVGAGEGTPLDDASRTSLIAEMKEVGFGERIEFAGIEGTLEAPVAVLRIRSTGQTVRVPVAAIRDEIARQEEAARRENS